jgi:GSH-dependent disulfide-bond oxidoreductase
MIDLYFAPTPNGWKITIMLEECHLPYNVIPVNLGKGEQFAPEFLKISPNNRMPAIVDHETGLHIFESGAILQYLAEKTGRFMPADPDGKFNVLQWLFWQVGGLGPMAGQLSHFVNYAPGGPAAHEYAHTRYRNEYDRLFAVMERSLSQHEYLAGEYSIADMAAWPWVVPYKHFGQDMTPYRGVRRWFDAIKHRSAVRRGMDVGRDAVRPAGPMTEEQRRIMFGQTGASVLRPRP